MSQFLIKRLAVAALNGCEAIKSKFYKRWKKGTVSSYCNKLTILPKHVQLQMQSQNQAPI